MPNVVLDASTVVSAALKASSVPEQALLLAVRRDIICLSDPVLGEIRDVLSRPKFAAALTADRRERILGLISAAAVFFDPTEKVRDCADPKDDKYLELAVAAEAAVIVSGDADLLTLDPWRGVRILRPADYVASMERRPAP